MEEPKQSKARKIFVYFALAMMLFVVPGMSWYFLKTGADVYGGLKKSLGEFGTYPELAFNSEKGEFDKSYFDKKLTVVQIAAPSNTGALGMMKYVSDQFTDNPNVQFLTLNSVTGDTSASYMDFRRNVGASTAWNFIPEHDIPQNQLRDSFRLAEVKEKHLILIDTNLVVREFYDYSDSMEMNKLITIMSLIMPRPEKAEIKRRPETEK